jgi:hypothetical protein
MFVFAGTAFLRQGWKCTPQLAVGTEASEEYKRTAWLPPKK